MDKTSSRLLGTASMLAASFCFSLGGLLIKLIPWNALALNGARNLIGAAVIGIYLLISLWMPHLMLRKNSVREILKSRAC